MIEKYHSGEREVQACAGVQVMANRMGKTIQPIIPPAARDFVRSQPMSVLGTVDADGRVWASLLTGEPGFMKVTNEHQLRIDPQSIPVALHVGVEVGLLVIDLATRRRMRVNGKAEMQSDGGVVVHVRQVYSNCPKYIQVRVLESAPYESGVPHDIRSAEMLTIEQQQWIARADTFFIASFHPEGGADASHRGGPPGFVRIVNGGMLRWPDYAGNNMFQTLGNIAANPDSGLLFIDFECGGTLQLTGQARVRWEKDCAVQFPGAERVVDFHVERAIEIAGASPFRWRFAGYSPFNPLERKLTSSQ